VIRKVIYKEQYLSLYIITRHKQDIIDKDLGASPLNMLWRRDLIGPKLVA